MNLSSINRIIVTLPILLLCIGISAYVILDLERRESSSDFDLFSLVPSNAISVVEISNISTFIKDYHVIYKATADSVSTDMFALLNEYVETVEKDFPHSGELGINKALISFHQGESSTDQVLYLSLSGITHSGQWLQTFLSNCCTSASPVKTILHLGLKVSIYLLNDGRFLAVHSTSKYLALSFQKFLIDEVIEAHKSQNSLLAQKSFIKIHHKGANLSPASFYIKLNNVEMGDSNDSLKYSLNFADWNVFEFKLSDDILYLMGSPLLNEPLSVSSNIFLELDPIDSLSFDKFPSSTIYLNVQSFSDKQLYFNQQYQLPFIKKVYPNQNNGESEAWISFLSEYIGNSFVYCVFVPNKIKEDDPCAIVYIPMVHFENVSRYLSQFVCEGDKESKLIQYLRQYRGYDFFEKGRSSPQFTIRYNTCFSQLSGMIPQKEVLYAALCNDGLILAADPNSLTAYIDAVNNKLLFSQNMKEIKLNDEFTENCTWFVYVDSESVDQISENYKRLLPKWILEQSQLLKNYDLIFRIVRNGNVLRPSFTLYPKN